MKSVWLFVLLVFTNISGLDAQRKTQPLDTQKVIFKHVDRETFAISYVLEGGTANYSKAKEGIELLALNWAAKGGTQQLNPTGLSKTIDSLGIELEIVSRYDYSYVTMIGLKKYWRSSFNIFTNILSEPRLEKDVFANIKETLSLEAYYMQQDPESRLFLQSMRNVFKNTDYHKIPEGNPSSLNQLQADEVAKYLKQLLSNQKGFLAVVGDFNETERAEIQRFAEDKINSGEARYPNSFVKLPTSIWIKEADLETNYLRGMIISPGLMSEEGFPMLLGIQVLNSRIFQRIRNEEGLSYDPTAYYPIGIIQNPYSIVQADSENPEVALSHIMEILQVIKTSGITEKELKHQKSIYLTRKYLGEETTRDQCEQLILSVLRKQRMTSAQFDQKIRAVSTLQVNTVLAKYLNNIYWTYLGNSQLLSERVIKNSTEIGRSIR